MKGGKLMRTLTLRQQSIVVGSILGDGRLDLTKHNKNASLVCWQCVARQGYVEWLHKELQPFTVSPITASVTKMNISGKSFKHVYFWTTHHPVFTKLRNLFYPNGKKIVPSNIGDYLDELTLAVWFMDDGCSCINYSMLSTCCFSIPECKLLLRKLETCFGVKGRLRVTMHPNGKEYPSLYLGKDGNKQLHNLVDPLLHEDFKYKRFKPGPGYARGERCGSAKLTAEEVREIRNLKSKGVLQKDIAARYNVTESTVSTIVNRKNWIHIP